MGFCAGKGWAILLRLAGVGKVVVEGPTANSNINTQVFNMNTYCTTS